MDAEWKLVQQKTFTRWCNEHLRHQGIIIGDLEVELSDGLRLIALLEALSQKKMKRSNNKAKLRAQKLENVKVALDFIASEKIKLVNIGTLNAWFVRYRLLRVHILACMQQTCTVHVVHQKKHGVAVAYVYRDMDPEVAHVEHQRPRAI